MLSFLRRRPFTFALILVGVVTALRIAGLMFSVLNLGPDETQYWWWSQTPDWGYYSKPPFIAWAIAATTALFGDGEWAVRLSSPLFHGGTAAILGLLGRRLYSAREGAWAALTWLLLPAVTLSSALVTTDVYVLFFWSLAMLAFFAMAEETPARSVRWAFVFGAALGLGLLAKYAMIYLPLGAALAAALSPKIRRGVRLRDLAIAGVVAGAIVAPNIAWNAAHDFQTVAHTAANADWGGTPFHPAAFANFLGAQFGVFGPLLFAALLWGVIRLPARLRDAGEARGRDLALLAFAAPPLVLVAAEALISRAHANWAAAAYPAASVLVCAWACRSRHARVLKASLALHGAVFALLLVGASSFAIADGLGLSNAVKRVRGWPVQGAEIAAHTNGFDAILSDDREMMGGLLYYVRPRRIPIVAWNENGVVDNHYEAFNAFDPKRETRVLLVTRRAAPGALAAFADVEPLGEVSVDLKRGRERRFHLYALSGYRGVSR